MIEKRIILNATDCSECITVTLEVPKGCRFDTDIIEARAMQLFKMPIFKDLCHGCSLENREPSD